MPVELDHLFILTNIGAPEAERLLDFGLTEGSSNRHPGQGTANRRFFFGNFMLELLWVCDREEARSPAIRPTHLWERWRDRDLGACPFGLALRYDSDLDSPPFTYWNFQPPYLPEGLSIPVANNAAILTEPFLFSISFGHHPRDLPASRQEPRQHTAGFHELTRLCLHLPLEKPASPALRAIGDRSLVHLETCSQNTTALVKLEFDGGSNGTIFDCRPELPLILRK